MGSCNEPLASLGLAIVLVSLFRLGFTLCFLVLRGVE